MEQKKPNWKKIRHNIIEYVCIITGVVLLFTFVVGIGRVGGDSMYPTLQSGELVFYQRLGVEYKTTDVVKLELKTGEIFVKRIVATGGDTVDIQDGKLLVNGTVVDESYAYGVTEPKEMFDDYPVTLGKDEIFVLGDNRENSIDSRVFGPISRKCIKGRILYHWKFIK